LYSKREEKLKEVIDELRSAETIIKILQMGLHSTRTIENTCARNQIATEGPSKTPITKEWALRTPKINTKNHRCMTSETRTRLQQPTSPSRL
jgi:hypothetical protein